ncbi:hypothetical protein GeomeDRAFT_3412 [Geobacter metallireducens RCH3]|uniref:Uncharacterized protein n=1 Tax=Geobacter metallireducens (strain ATCC 53774 / DSM 7210 / GS-15) TaxID=269799 RepID=Q39SG6_GEOMG|nr:STM3941 family protein [Geobacter metallireducens]ABB32808.1 hypothetical protein Gmet_2589 [Geobacter metallireducens GS-15]EHP83781.1 hypothetical protein GeomeDRAFT_3412 [Geobacter metallireducens RCH3]
MNLDDQRVIELSKNKIFLLFLGAWVFVTIGIWLLQMDSAEIESSRRFNSPLFVHAIGVMGILFFGFVGVSWANKLFRKESGLILSPAGIVDNSCGWSAGFIPWSEIVGLDIIQVQYQKIIIIKVTNPNKYIEDRGIVKRVFNSANLKMYGSPITLTSSSLKISFNDLVDECRAYFAKYGGNA